MDVLPSTDSLRLILSEEMRTEREFLLPISDHGLGELHGMTESAGDAA
jgi:hypothetical protein